MTATSSPAVDVAAGERAEVATPVPTTTARWGAGLIVAVVLVLAAGVGLRLVHVGDPLVEFHPTRQYISVDLAWKYQMAWGGDGTEQDRAAASIRDETEPPVMEVVTAAVWRAMGSELLWVPRVLTIAVWTIGGLGIALLLRRLMISAVGVVVGVVTWTFLPFVVQATRVFQPDPLMVVAIVYAVLALVVDDERRTTRSLVVAALAAGFAVFVKAPSVFFVASSFVAVTWHGRGARALVGRRTLAFVAIALPAALLYNAVGLWVLGFLQDNESNFIFPRMLLTADFWNDWSSLVVATFGLPILVLALVGVATARGRALVVGVALLVGYVSYGVVFTWNYSTHNYYHLPLVIVLALGCGFLASSLEALVRRRRGDLLSVGIAALVGATFVAGWTTSVWPLVPRAADPASVDRKVRVSREVGEATGHTDRALLLGENYGYPLAFYGSVRGTPWPWSADIDFETSRGDAPMTVDERFAVLSAEASPDFFVVTSLDEWERQPDLRAFLADRYPLYAEGPGYLVFDLRR